MKKSFSILGAFCLGLFISVSIIACAVDGDYNGNNPGELTPQEEQVPYVVKILSENEFEKIEATYDGDCINGWCVYYKDRVTGNSSTFTVKVHINGNLVYIEYLNGYRHNDMPSEMRFSYRCNLHELRSEHIDRYNALISQIMMMWYAKVK